MSVSAAPLSPFRGYRFPPEIITHAVWLYHRFLLSHRDVEELLAERGIQVSYEAIRLWCRLVRPTAGKRAPSAAFATWRQVVPGRSGAHNQQASVLAMACRRPGWNCVGHPGSEST